MPHKFNAARRHKFDKAQYRVINWAEYNESLRQRGDLTIWVSDEAQSVWSAVVCVKFCKKYFRKIQFLSVDRRRACGNVGKLNVFGEAFPSLRGNPRLLADFL